MRRDLNESIQRAHLCRNGCARQREQRCGDGVVGLEAQDFVQICVCMKSVAIGMMYVHVLTGFGPREIACRKACSAT